MIYLTIFLSILLVVYGIMKLRGRKLNGTDLDDPLNPEQIKSRRENLDKIIALAGKTSRITNHDVQSALGISDATTTRYLKYLVDLGKLIRLGERGQQVYYQINNNYKE